MSALPEDVAELLSLNVATMTRAQRRRHKRELEPRLPAMQRGVAALFDRERLAKGPAAEREWAVWIATDILHRGYTSIVAGLAMDVVGRRAVTKVLEGLK